MAIWYFGVLLFSIFSSLYFVYSGDRFAPTDNLRQNVAGIFATCHNAAVAAAQSNTTLGATAAVSLSCSEASLGATAGGLLVPDIKITIVPGSTLLAGADGRTVVTYLSAGQSLNGVPFTEVLTEVQSNYNTDIGTGLVTGNDTTSNKIVQQSSIIVRVPKSINAGDLAMTTNLATRCPVTTLAANSKCYVYYNTPVKQAAAAAACGSVGGGHLASLRNATDATTIKSMTGGAIAWVDGARNGTNWIYSDGKKANYLPWASGEPNNAGGSENCLNIYSNGTINDMACTDPTGYINGGYVCEY